MLTLYNATSSDGFVATMDGGEDFIPESAWNDFCELCTHYDAVALSRKAYEAMQRYPARARAHFEKLPAKKLVVSRRHTFQVKPGYKIIFSPQDIFTYGAQVLATSGAHLNTVFLDAGMVDKIILNVFPRKIGAGIPVFLHEPQLVLEKEVLRASGSRWREYTVHRS